MAQWGLSRQKQNKKKSMLWYEGQIETKTILLKLLDPADERTTISRKFGKYSPNNTASRRRKLARIPFKIILSEDPQQKNYLTQRVIQA
jgi:hypothetical protein